MKWTPLIILKITTKINNVGIDGVKFISNIVGNLQVLQYVEFSDDTGVPRFILQRSNDLSFNAFHSGVKCTIGTLSANRVTVLNRWTNVQEAILFLNGLGMDQKKNVMHQQLKSTRDLTYVGEKKYEFDTIVRAFEYFALSRTTYKRLREDFELPSIETLTRLTSKVKSVDDESYLKTVFRNLKDDRQKTCILVLDEIYVKSTLTYRGGIWFGKAVNNPNVLANTVLSFMIITLFGGPKFLHKMLPVKNLDATFLFEQTTAILSSIKLAGGNVVATILDGNRVNQTFFKMFDTISPWRTKEGKFLLFDFVHLMKNIRNSWITEETQDIEFCVDRIK